MTRFYFLRSFVLTILIFSATSQAQENEAPATVLSPPGAIEGSLLLPSDDIQLEFTTYGSVNAFRRNDYRSPQDANPPARWRTDLERVVLEPELEMGSNIKLEAEIEFEHGGTGSAVEYEAFDEAGEFETEIEAGGEVIVEKLMLQVESYPWLNYRVGYITVPVGMISQRHHPHEYFTTSRNYSEERILPSTWRETGVSLFGDLGLYLHYELGLFNGLNSEQFRKSSWIKEGQMRIYEDMTADSPALALRMDFGRYFTQSLAGFSIYRGDSAANRRVSDRLTDDANVLIWDAHYFYDSPTWTVRAMYLRGSLSNADKVILVNKNNVAGPTRPSPLDSANVGSEAEAWFVEAGRNIQTLIKSSHRLDLFARYDSVNPQKKVDATILRDERVIERGWTAGANWYLRPEIVFKAQYGEMKAEASELPTNKMISFGFGYFFSTEG